MADEGNFLGNCAESRRCPTLVPQPSIPRGKLRARETARGSKGLGKRGTVPHRSSAFPGIVIAANARPAAATHCHATSKQTATNASRTSFLDLKITARLQYRYSNPGTRRSWACGASVGIIVTVAASMRAIARKKRGEDAGLDRRCQQSAKAARSSTAVTN